MLIKYSCLFKKNLDVMETLRTHVCAVILMLKKGREGEKTNQL